MTDFVRRLVSGNKARFKDDELDLELDLVYVTDQIIIMGYPAAGIEGLYRNRREDAIRFLEHRHGKNYWVFNFCPIKENSYDASTFSGRVSRYPFPDHHAPPLAVMPLVAREIRAWLSGSKDRVAVLHCKAGKGRSGTMACSYILAHDQSTAAPKLERSFSKKEWAKRRIQTTIETLPPDEDGQPTTAVSESFPQHHLHSPIREVPHPTSDAEGLLDVEKGSSSVVTSPVNTERSFTDALKGVLDLHTARRMKPSDTKDVSSGKEVKVKQGVSIPSQRRFLYYWALLLAHDAPKHVWAVDRVDSPLALPSKIPSQHAPFVKSKAPRPKVRLTQMKLRMKETSSVKLGIVKAANKVIEKTSMAKGPGVGTSNDGNNGKEKDKSSPSSQVWASLARYDDALVDLLEEWEVYTRDSSGDMGTRRRGSEHIHRAGGEESTEDKVLSEIFQSGKWDQGKMVRSFARLGGTDETIQEKVVDQKEGKVHVYNLKPLSDKRWEGLKHDLSKNANNDDHNLEKTFQAIDKNASAVGVSRSEANSMYDVTTGQTAGNNGNPSGVDQGVILDAGREIRIKLYMGQVFMGWMWFIPTFHMPQPPPTSAASTSDTTKLKSTLTLTRKDLDFPLGIGSAILDVEIEMEWVVPAPATSGRRGPDVEVVEPPLRARTEDSKIGTEPDPEPSGIAAAVQAVITPNEALGESGGEGLGSVGVREAVEAKQGAAD